MTFIPSPQQAAAIDWTVNGAGSLFVQARAGTGKTTTLVEMLRETSGRLAFAAYNRKIADEIKVKCVKAGLISADVKEQSRGRIQVGTFHSFGLRAWKQVYKDVKCKPEHAREKRDMTVAKFREVGSPKMLDGFVLKLTSLAKQRAIGLFGSIDDASLWYDMVDHFDLAFEIEDPDLMVTIGNDMPVPAIEAGVKLAQRTLRWQHSLSPKIVDFDDMIYAPLVSSIRFFPNDWIFVDEAQDTNPARRALARKMLRTGGRAVFVGDDRQAIYGFTGADSDAIDQITREFGCKTMPLTVTRRCPKTVVALAQTIVPDIEAHEEAPEGSISETDDVTFLQHAAILKAHDAVLCRNTKPLVSTAFALMKKGVACHVEGRDIGQGLIKLINRFGNSRDLDHALRQLDLYAEKEVTRLTAKGRETQAEAVRDRVDTIHVIAENVKTLEELRTKITSMFEDAEKEPKPTLTLCTAHRSKGREWDRVFILGRNAYMPSPWARQAWQQLQERNLEYVAITRAKRELVMINVTSS